MSRVERRTLRHTLIAAAAAAGLAGHLACANPVGPVVVNGQATFNARGNLLSVTNSPGAIINWQQFSIGANETTRFIQQSAASAVLNRVAGADPSRILGTLQSNGRVFVINPSGIVFGANSRIDVAGLVASTLHLSNADFISGRMNFTSDAARAEAVVNQGRIAAHAGGRVYLVGSAVDNQGVITAPNGDIVLAAGKSVRVTEGAATGVQIEITAPADRALNLSELTYSPRGVYGGFVRNSGAISADSAVRGADGSITLKASRGVTLASGSRVSANGPDGGRIVIDAQQGVAAVSGSVEATGSTGRGGRIAIAGEQTSLLDGAHVEAAGAGAGGTVLIGGDFQGRRIEDGDLTIGNSQRTFVSSTAVLRADAMDAGDGGKVIVWADETTRYYGNITAKGGTRGGNGGAVEVSGKRNLAFDGKVDTSAARGKAGSLLLDPDDLFISAGIVGGALQAGTNPFQAVDGVNDYFVTAATLQALPAATAVNLQANHDIIFQTGLVMATTAAGSISMSASNQIQMAGFGLTTAGGSVSMNAGSGGISSLGPINLAGGALTINSSGSSSQGAGVISGTTRLVKSGIGTLTLSAANTYTGTTTVNGGTLSLSGGSAIANTVAVTVGAAGTLDLQNHETIGSLAGAAGAQVTLNANTLTTGNATNTTFAGVMSGAGGGLTKQGTGAFTLTGANTYTGATAVNAGVLNLRNATATGATTGGVTVASGAALELQGGITVGNEALSITGTGVSTNGALRNISGDNAWGGTVTLTGAATIQSDASTLTLSGVTGAGQNVTFTGAGNHLLNGVVSTTTGTVTKTGAGTLALGAGNVMSDTGSLIVNGGTFDIAIFSDTVGAVQLLGGTITGTTGILASTTAYDLQSGTVSAVLGGTAGVNKTTTGTVTLSRANAYSGATSVTGGTLAVTANDALGTTAAGTTVASGGTLDFQNVAYTTLEPLTLSGGTVAASTGTSSFANAITLSAASVASAGAGAQLTLTGAISDGGSGFSLTKTGVGALAMGASNLLADTVSLVMNGGVLDFGTASDTVAGVQLLSGSIAGSGTLTSTTAFDLQGGASGMILAGAVGATKTGGGTVTLSAANTYTGITTIDGGVLSVTVLANGGLASGIGQSSSAAANLVLGGGTLQYTGGSVPIDRNFTLTAGTSSGIDVSSATTNVTLTGVSAATSGSLTKSGSGTLTLSAAQLHTGTTGVSAGTLALGADERLDDSSRLVVSGGTFSIGAFNETVAGVRLQGGSIAGTTGVLTSTSDFDLQAGAASAILTGTVGATKTTTGTVMLSGTNTYTGATTIDAGILSVSALANGGVASNIGRSTNAAANLVLGGGTLQYTGPSVTIDRNFTLTAGTTSSIDVNPAATNLTLTGAGAATSGSLTKLGAGTLTLSTPNLYTGTTTVSAGTLAYAVDDALASGPVTVSGGTWAVGPFSDTVGTVTLVDGSITGTTGLITGTSYDVRNGSISAILTGGGSLAKTTSGTVTLSGRNTYTGSTTVSDGRLVLGASDTLDDATHLVVNGNSATFDIGSFNDTVAGVQLLAGTITGTTGVLTSITDFDLQGGTVSAILAGFTPGVGLVKSGPGTVTLTRENLYQGATAVNGGTLAVTSNNALGTTDEGTTVENGATLDFQNVAYTTPEALTLHGGTVATSTGTSSFAGPASLTANSTASVAGTQLTLSGIMSESGGHFGLTKIGAGTLVLSAHNTYEGTTQINAGTVRLGVADALHDASRVVVDNTLDSNSTFDMVSFNDTVAGVQLVSGTITGTSGVLTSTSNYDLRSGTVSAIITGTVGVDKTTAGTVTLSRDNTYTGATAVAAGTLRVTAPNALGTITAGTAVTGGATLSIVNTAVVAEPVTLNGNGVGGIGALTGTGTASLAGSVTLDSDSTIGVAAAADALTLSGVVEGTGALSLIGAGTLTFGDTVGATAALASLTQSAPTRLRINGGLVRTSDGQTYNGPVTTGGAATLRTTANGNISAPGVFNATAGTLTLDTGTGSATLTNVLNDFSTVQVTSGGAISLVDANNIIIGDASMTRLTARALSGNLTLGGNVMAGGGGDSIVLVASGNFINTAGAAALDPGPGRWLVYSTNPGSDTRDGLAYDFKQYDATFLPATPVAQPTGNGFLYSVRPLITPGLTGSATKGYDATTAATLNAGNYSFSGALDGDVIALGNATSGIYDTPDINVAPATLKLVTVTGLTLAGASNGGAPVYGYQLASGGTTASGNIGVITPALLTITPTDQSKTYGQTFTFAGTEFTASGLQGGQTIALVSLASAGAPATAHVADSPYAIAGSAASGGTFTPGNYTITYGTGQLTVNPAPLTVTANDQVKAYGGSPFVFAGTEFTVSGLQNADAIASVTLASAGAAPAAPVTLPPVSPYPITLSAATGINFVPGNYTITYVPGQFTVNPAGVALTVTANNQVKTYGTTLTFTGSEFTATGLQNSETIGRVVLSSPGAPAAAHVSGSPYEITVSGASGGTFNAGNYTIVYVGGQLTVVRAPLTVRADDKSRLANTDNPPFTATYSGFRLGETPAVLTGSLMLNTAATATSPVGDYPIVPSGQTATDYAITFVNGTLAVRQPRSLLSRFPGLTDAVIVALEQLGIDDFNRDISNCLNEDIATSPAIAPKVGRKPPRNCSPSAAGVTESPRSRTGR